ncbi:hypothetical protein AB0C98_00955 [Streptomyces sp. NPDC048558]|uniref:hypothetical protein n=1 Tax=Streptomyces sp. NPDC048558 TaxID=3155759 RepID=UPI0033D274A5
MSGARRVEDLRIGGGDPHRGEQALSDGWAVAVAVGPAEARLIALYKKVWKTLSESAVYAANAHNLINSARRALNAR